MTRVIWRGLLAAALIGCGEGNAAEPSDGEPEHWLLFFRIVDTANVSHAAIAYNCGAGRVPLELHFGDGSIEGRYGYLTETVPSGIGCQWSDVLYQTLAFSGQIKQGTIHQDSISFEIGSLGGWALKGRIVGDSMGGTVRNLAPELSAPREMGGTWWAVVGELETP